MGEGFVFFQNGSIAPPFDFLAALLQHMHHLAFLHIGHALPVKPLFPAAQTAFAVAFVVDLAYADTRAGNIKKFKLFHMFP